MIPKISLAAAFVLMVAPPMACASNRAAANSAPVASPQSMVLAQDAQEGQPSMGTTENDNDNSTDSDNDNDSNDNTDDNQNADNGQNADTSQADQNPGGDYQTVPPTILGPDNDQGEPRQAPMNPFSQPVNPYQ